MEESRFLHELRQYLIEHWSSFNLPGSPDKIAYRIRQIPKGRALDRSRLVALWFFDNPEELKVVTKWVFNKEYSSFILQEHQHSRWLYEVKGHRFVPKPLGCPEILGVPVLIEEAVRGRSLAHRLIGLQPDEKPLREMFAMALEILSKIQEERRPATRSAVLEELSPYLERAETVLAWGEKKKERVRDLLGRFPFDPVPGSGETLLVGDFAPQNILTGPDGTYLIDLEFSRKSVLAFLDPLSFVNSLFRFTVYPDPEKEASQTLQIFERDLLERESVLGKLSAEFLGECGMSVESQEWCWLLYFIHEAAFQHFLSETFSAPIQQVCDGFISVLVNRLEKR